MDLISFLKKKIRTEWDRKWFLERENKLREIKGHTNVWKTSVRGARREEVVLTRLRIGHTKLTHSYLMAKHPPTLCDTCGTELSVKTYSNRV